jgi:hypothetical protein
MIELLLVYCSPFRASAICSLGLVLGNADDNLYCDRVCKRRGTAVGVPCEYFMLKNLKLANKI